LSQRPLLLLLQLREGKGERRNERRKERRKESEKIKKIKPE